jgi:hypothetical protein
MDDAMICAVDSLKGRISEKVSALQNDPSWQEIQKLYQGLGVLEDLCGLDRTGLGELLGITGQNGSSNISSAAVGKFEFVTDSPLEAAKKFLRKLATRQQKAAGLDEIINGLERGGLTKVNRDDLRISLGRSTTEIYKVSDDVYGLLEFFPNVRRGSPGRRKGPQGNGADDKEESGKENQE